MNKSDIKSAGATLQDSAVFNRKNKEHWSFHKKQTKNKNGSYRSVSMFESKLDGIRAKGFVKTKIGKIRAEIAQNKKARMLCQELRKITDEEGKKENGKKAVLTQGILGNIVRVGGKAIKTPETIREIYNYA